MVKDKTMIKDKSIRDKIKKTFVGALAGASVFVAGDAIAQQQQQQQPQDAQEVQDTQEIQQETQTSFFSEQEKKFNEASYNLGFYMLWKDANQNKQIETSELVNIPDDVNSDPKLLENAIQLTTDAAKLSPELKLHDLMYIRQAKKVVDEKRIAYEKYHSGENKQALRKALRDLDLLSRQWVKHDIDFSVLPEAYQKVMWKILYNVVPSVESIFFVQKDSNNLKYKADIIRNGDIWDYIAFWYNGGPWCLKNEEKKKDEQWRDELCSSHPDFPKKVPNAGHWPANFTQKEIDSIKSPQKNELLSSFVYRFFNKDGELDWRSINSTSENPDDTTVPNYKKQMEHLTNSLKALSVMEDIDSSLRRFFDVRSSEFKDKQNPFPFFKGDESWINLDSLIEIILGFYEEEHSPQQKTAMMELTFGMRDNDYTKIGESVKKLIPGLEEMIAKKLGDDYIKRDFKTNPLPPLIFAAYLINVADGRCIYVPAGHNLPNCPVFGISALSKKVIVINNTFAREKYISLPIAEIIMDAKQLRQVNREYTVLWVMAHEIAHGLGPTSDYPTLDLATGEIKKSVDALGKYYGALEEAKADALGIVMLKAAVDAGILPEETARKAVLSVFPSYMRGLAYGMSDSHGVGAILEFVELHKAGVIVETSEGKYKMNLDSPHLYEAFENIAVKIMKMQKNGDREAKDNWIKESEKYVEKHVKKEYLAQIYEMPRDVRPLYSFKFSPNVEREMFGEMQKEMKRN